MSVSPTAIPQESVLEPPRLHVMPAGLVTDPREVSGGIWPASLSLWSALIYMALFMIRPWEQLFPWLNSWPFERTYVICMLVVVLLGCGFRLAIDRVTGSLALFTASIVVSMIYAYDRQLAWSAPKGCYFFLTLVVFYYVLISVIRRPYELIVAVTAYVVITGVYIGKALWEFYLHGAGAWSMGVLRLRGIDTTFSHPNAVATSVVVSLPIWHFLWRSRHVITESWSQAWRQRLSLGLAIYPILAAWTVIHTNSRTGLLGFAVATLVLGFRQFGGAKRILEVSMVVVVLLATGWILMPSDTKDRFTTIWNPEVANESAQASAEGRIYALKAAMEMLRRYPLTGVGVGNFIAFRTAEIDGIPLASHGILSEAVGQVGLLGTIAFAVYVLVVLGLCRRIKRVARVIPDRVLLMYSELAVASQLVMFFLVFQGLTGDTLFRYLWYWVGAFMLLAWEFTQQRVALLTGRSRVCPA